MEGELKDHLVLQILKGSGEERRGELEWGLREAFQGNFHFNFHFNF